MNFESFKITRLNNFQEASNLHGYFVESTATINVEDGDSQTANKGIELYKLTNLLGIKRGSKSQTHRENHQQSIDIDEIVAHLVKVDNPQLVINIHGYSIDRNSAKEKSEHIYDYGVNNKLCQKNSIFIGYRWPSKNVSFSTPILQEALEALPTLLLGILITTLALIFIPVSLIFGKWTLFWAIISFSLSFLVWFSAQANGALPIFPNGISLVLFSSGLFFVLKYPFSTIQSKLDTMAIFYPSLSFLKDTINFWSSHFWVLLVITIALILAIIYQTVVKKKPIFPNHLSFFFFCLATFLIFTIAINWFNIPTSWLLVSLFSFCISLCSIVFALILLRLSNYPRHRFRAFNYGVMDLVEFIRKLEQAIMDNQEKSEDLKIDLSFIAHSLGCEVVTQTIRILINVFDQNQDDPYINDCFKLERLVLVAPDIPVESILSGRANFLQYSLRRVNESYIFSNEADLALRLASTAANYFSFPSKSRFRGYKLGNVTAKHFDNQHDKRDRRLEKQSDYGIINLHIDYQGEQERLNPTYSFEEPINWLEIRASNIEHRSLQELVGTQSCSTENVANQFTYFDCTDYRENGKGVLNYALNKSALNIFDYFSLMLAKPLVNIDGHGDYFKGKFSQKMIYELAFLGFKEFLHQNNENSQQKPLTKFAQDCREKYIQAILSAKLQKLFVLP